ncbi:MAG TPA: hypothetical protein VHM91_22205 [Verrucomicrobiales bacterium]|jgi:hypothetical protein|nr:hypothetical protein [Verrucomicrobiales bacterium]
MSHFSKTLPWMGTGVVFAGLLILKLCGKIEWSWWWVTSPLWLPFTVLAGALVFCSLIALLASKRERSGPGKR